MSKKSSKAKSPLELDIKVNTSKVHKGKNAPEDQLFYTVKAKQLGKVISETELGPASFEFKVNEWTFKGELIKKFRKKFRI